MKKLLLTLFLFVIPASATTVRDRLGRPDGTLGGQWSASFGQTPGEGVATATGGGVVLVSHNFAPDSTKGGDGYSVWTGTSFGNSQYAKATISAIAPFTSTISISAATKSGGNCIYTYTLSAGSALITPQQIIISGMSDAGNNTTTGFLTTSLGAGTFTVANAGCVNATVQSGAGVSPSDSNAGLCVRCTPDGLNGYFFIAGTNSFSGDGRVYDRELWKLVGGVATHIVSQGQPITSIPDSPGDSYTLWVAGINLYVFKTTAAGAVTLIIEQSDSALTSGSPGVWTWSLGGAHEYDWTNWGVGAIMSSAPGNNGTQWSNFVGGDDFGQVYRQLSSDTFTEGTTQVATDAFQRVDENPLAGNWTKTTTTAQQIVSHIVEPAAAANARTSSFWNANAFNNDQYSDVTIGTTATSFTGSEVRMVTTSGENGYIALLPATGSAGTGFIQKEVHNAATTLASFSITPQSGDVIRISVIGTNITLFQNGLPKNNNTTDAALLTGSAGMFQNVTSGAVSNSQITAWAGGNSFGLPANFSFGTGQFFSSSPTAGALATSVNGSAFARLWENSVIWPASQYAEAVLTSASEPNTTTGPAIQVSTSADTAYVITPGSGSVSISKWVAGVQTMLDTQVNTYAVNNTYRIENFGGMVVGKINGVILLMGLDSALTTGKAGVFDSGVGNYLTPSKTLKSWAGGQVGAGGTTTAGPTKTAGPTVKQ